MYPESQPAPAASFSNEFYLQIKQVLENFYDFPYLNNHPLAKTIRVARSRASESDGQRLRRVFLMALEELKPGGEAAQKTLQARYYSLINLRYIESGTMQHVANDLGISERQAYRDLKRAEESLTALLWERVGRELSQTDPARPPEAPGAEAVEEALELQLRPVNARDLLANAVHAVERLAQQQNAHLELDLPEAPLMLYTDPRLAQQVLINLLSHILQNSATPLLRVTLQPEDERAGLSFTFATPTPLQFENPLANQFIRQLGWKLALEPLTPDGTQTFRLAVEDQETTLLVIDDHAPLIELLRRFLTHTRCQVIGVSDGLEGLQLARSLLPDVILLDVMMPEIDGWEVLQRLRNTPETAAIPVVICSIFNDPKLAYSLGATALLTKPVNREKLLEVLRSLKISQ